MSDYRINGVDPELQYRLVIERGFNSQVRTMPELKDNGLSINWAGDDGTERYHGNRKFGSKSYSIGCAIMGNSPTDLLENYNRLEEFLLTSEIFHIDDLNAARRYKVFYSKMTSLQVYGSWARFSLELIDDYPTDKFPIA